MRPFRFTTAQRCAFPALLVMAIILPMFFPPVAEPTPNAQRFLDGVRHYEAGEWPEAVAAFEALVNSGIENPKLYYNLANAHLKNGQLGRAILWYERAQRMAPGDPDLRFNLDYARTRLKDEAPPSGSPLLQVLFFWKDLLSTAGWQRTSVTCALFFWCLLAASVFLKIDRLRVPAWVLAAAAFVSAGTAVYEAHAPSLHPRAVILKEAAPVRSGLSTAATELFVLHEGTVVAVEKQRLHFIKIRYAKDKIGWISNETAEII